MKNRIMLSLILASGMSAAPAWAAQKVTVHVKGMVCDMCSRGLTKGFNAFKEKSVLEDFKVELSKHTVELNLRDGASISDLEIKKVVEDSSLSIDKIDR